MNINLLREIENIILSTNKLKDTYIKNHPNSKYSLTDIISELLYFLKSGVSWNLLRSHINPKTLYWHYSNFVQYNVFYRLFKRIRNVYLHNTLSNNVSLYIDSTSIYNKSGIRKIGRNKFYKNKNITKISLMTDSNGFPLSVLFMKGNYHDNSVFNKHIRDAIVLIPKKSIRIIADKAYSSKSNYELLDKHNFQHIIPPRKNMKIYKSYNYNVNDYKKRIKIEHFFSRLKSFKHINIRYDKRLNTYIGFVYFALSIIAYNLIK